MYDVLRGVRVVEVASWVFAPTTAAILADWGAEVIKVEEPITGDPMRGLVNAMTAPGGFNPLLTLPNHGKRSIGLDLKHGEGLELLLRLVDEADVFITNLPADVRTRLGIDDEQVLARNPRIVYLRGTGHGPVGPEAERNGYDLASVWARSGFAYQVTVPGGVPPQMPASMGDLVASMTAAGGVAAALYRREQTGQGGVVDVSLYGVGMWMMGPTITTAAMGIELPMGDRELPANPIANSYRTKDDRWIWLVMLQADRFWADLCRHIGREDLVEDARFADHAARVANLRACVGELDDTFATRTLAQWQDALAPVEGVWAPVSSPREVATDPQALANGYFAQVEGRDGSRNGMVASPVQFDGAPIGDLDPDPEHGQHTEEVLLELGLTWDDLVRLKGAGVIS